MKYPLLLLTSLLVAIIAPMSGGTPPDGAHAQTSERCFAETGYCISGRIREFWEGNGGIPIFGLPISPLRTEMSEGKPLQVQWFERNRLELHPENARPFDVLLSRLGVDLLLKQGRDWWLFPRSEPQEGCRFFAETGHSVCGAVLAAWRASGLELDGRSGKNEEENLALFGMPISDAMTEQLSDGRTYMVQWFERVRFELHPENASSAVLLGLLGSEMQHGTVSAAPAPVSHFEPGDCPFALPGDLWIECGTLVVPQNRRQTDGTMLRLAVSVVHAPGSNPAPDPLLYLSGGPGSPAVNGTVGLARSYARFMGNRDLIVFDQRGTGFSHPSLVCPEINQVGDRLIEEGLSRIEKVHAEAEALLQCHGRLVSQGVDTTAYSSAASAADMEDLRQALGYAQWNIYAISYGTRLALTAMRDYPASIRSVILDSTYPLQTNLYTAMPYGIDRAFRMLFNNCAASPACNAAYPNLEQVFYATVARMNAAPVTIQVRHPRTGATIVRAISGDDVIDNLFRMTYRTAELPGLPQFIYDTANGRYATLARFESDRLDRMFGGSFSQGMYFAVQCNEEIPFATLEEMQAQAAAYPHLQSFFGSVMEFTEHIYRLCTVYGVQTPDPRENEPVMSDIPTLLLAGEYDPITPPDWAPLAAQTLSRSYVYQFPATGHAVISRGACPVGMMRAFLSDPLRAPDGSCIWY